ncbi:heavy-metal-associated domain-containing protein [Mycolicibacterium sp. BiH015]|uniref:heavy-metal-associated domain-containing protein n=1 Tax=Mycolicibacterium sp. BiH015 TaxID=3018808 RepID=UPI0022E5684C|nr:heavy-metal-associated domain-containing protein [Mycolicibacterium sp. BiH015]MDA2894881.1 heavy-metal-associated domain-containing protein [Mycolicibacterium sp. BiH015]
MTTTITVEGMSCGGCANSVRAELTHIPGVLGVDVDVSNGTVTIASESPVDDEAIRAAVEEAGYTLAG